MTHSADPAVDSRPRTAPATLHHHYDAAAAIKDNCYCIGDSTDWQSANIVELLDLKPGHRVVDMGAGDGAFASVIHRRASLRRRTVCVDPSANMTAKAQQRPSVEAVNEDCITFTTRPEESYDRIFFKEVVHHLPIADLPSIFRNVHKQLTPGGVVLIATRPKSADHVPIFPRAREVWSANQPAEEVFLGALRDGGFDDVTVEKRGFAMRVPRDEWLALCRSRFWSCFAPLTDDEMEKGMADLERSLAGVDVVEWTDTYIYIKERLKIGFGFQAAVDQCCQNPQCR
mmetsp:Transcript_30343/g.88199  ORF Transcript_30343/g.88199 Transcript_30343/m.88199 type:complete len:286 (+) Transcript_30343:64-921(+)